MTDVLNELYEEMLSSSTASVEEDIPSIDTLSQPKSGSNLEKITAGDSELDHHIRWISPGRP